MGSVNITIQFSQSKLYSKNPLILTPSLRKCKTPRSSIPPQKKHSEYLNKSTENKKPLFLSTYSIYYTYSKHLIPLSQFPKPFLSYYPRCLALIIYNSISSGCPTVVVVRSSSYGRRRAVVINCYQYYLIIITLFAPFYYLYKFVLKKRLPIL